MLSDVFDKECIKILTLFSISPGSKFTRNELKAKSFMNNVTLDAALHNLVKNKFLMKQKRFFSVNFGNETAREIVVGLARREHLLFKEIPLKILFLIMDFSKNASEQRAISQIYLFGSYSKLIYTEKSDVDLAVVLDADNKTLEKMLGKYAKRLEKKYNTDVQLHFFVKRDMKQKDKLISEILRNGICFF